MSLAGTTLDGFAYGEHLEGLPPRSLGYRLLTPLEPQSWAGEVEALARRLQGAPYPDHWPPTDLFCSVLLADGRRLVALARYGLADHTSSQRRGGLELVGVTGPADLDVTQALAVYHWLRARRDQAESLHALGGRFALADVLSAVAPAPPPADPVPVLPVRLWQEGALLFAASTPSEPDHRLALLDQGAGRRWQWLPLVGADFPLPTYAQRGPLIAWTPHLAGVALRVDRRPDAAPAAPRPRLLAGLLAAALLLGMVGLTVLCVVNGQATRDVARQLEALASAPPPAPAPAVSPPVMPLPTPSDDGPDRFALALHDLLQERLDKREWAQSQQAFLARYERIARQRPELRVADANTKGKLAIGAIGVLSGRSADRVEELVKKGLANKGFDALLVDLAAERVRNSLLDEARQEP